MSQLKKIYWGDKLGITSAILCIIHCLSAPILLTMGFGFLHNPIIAVLFIILAFISIYNVTRDKNLKVVSFFLWTAFTGFVISILFEERSDFFKYTMYLSSLCIIVGHLYHIRYCIK